MDTPSPSRRIRFAPDAAPAPGPAPRLASAKERAARRLAAQAAKGYGAEDCMGTASTAEEAQSGSMLEGPRRRTVQGYGSRRRAPREATAGAVTEPTTAEMDAAASQARMAPVRQNLDAVHKLVSATGEAQHAYLDERRRRQQAAPTAQNLAAKDQAGSADFPADLRRIARNDVPYIFYTSPEPPRPQTLATQAVAGASSQKVIGAPALQPGQTQARQALAPAAAAVSPGRAAHGAKTRSLPTPARYPRLRAVGRAMAYVPVQLWRGLCWLGRTMWAFARAVQHAVVNL